MLYSTFDVPFVYKQENHFELINVQVKKKLTGVKGDKGMSESEIHGIKDYVNSMEAEVAQYKISLVQHN